MGESWDCGSGKLEVARVLFNPNALIADGDCRCKCRSGSREGVEHYAFSQREDTTDDLSQECLRFEASMMTR